MLDGAVDEDLVESLVQAIVQAVAQCAQALRLVGHLGLRDLRGLAHADDAGDVERARPHAAFVAAAIDLRRQQHTRVAATHVERAYTLRAVHLVRGDRHDVDFQRVDVERNLARRLHRVGVEEDPLFLGDGADFGDRLDDADLVVRRHDRDEDRLV